MTANTSGGNRTLCSRTHTQSAGWYSGEPLDLLLGGGELQTSAGTTHVTQYRWPNRGTPSWP